MVRRVLWLALVCACTQDFSVFDPDGSAPNDGSSTDQATALDVGQDTQPIDAAGTDVTVDAPADISPADVKSDVVACTETGAITFGGHCYFLVTTAANAQAAQTACSGSGAHLVTITQASEQTAVVALGAGTERWIGLYRQSGQAIDSNYAWVTSEPRAGFAAWSPGEPNGSGQCARLLATGLWADDGCLNTHPYICERE